MDTLDKYLRTYLFAGWWPPAVAGACLAVLLQSNQTVLFMIAALTAVFMGICIKLYVNIFRGWAGAKFLLKLFVGNVMGIAFFVILYERAHFNLGLVIFACLYGILRSEILVQGYAVGIICGIALQIKMQQR